MRYNPETHHRKSIRLKGYDYSREGAYFITICCHNRRCLFGEIHNGKMHLNKFGKIAETEWLKTGEIRYNVELDAYAIMPNHVHGIIHITDVVVGAHCIVGSHCIVGAHCNVPLRQDNAQRNISPQTERFGKSTHNSIPTIVKLFKSTVTKQINQLRYTPGLSVWQRNYYEHVIRDDELYKIRHYIFTNSLQWQYDNENPKNLKVVKK